MIFEDEIKYDDNGGGGERHLLYKGSTKKDCENMEKSGAKYYSTKAMPKALLLQKRIRIDCD